MAAAIEDDDEPAPMARPKPRKLKLATQVFDTVRVKVTGFVSLPGIGHFEVVISEVYSMTSVEDAIALAMCGVDAIANSLFEVVSIKVKTRKHDADEDEDA